eukprot:scaffold72874_cov30-Tisochrysis_lutea.AAC.3
MESTLRSHPYVGGARQCEIGSRRCPSSIGPTDQSRHSRRIHRPRAVHLLRPSHLATVVPHHPRCKLRQHKD